ncbi:DHA2 family efflux MFS transporter permease subunit [Bacillus sp. PS06]|uniref:DHA2 family efflux MFS transporter permease subunit n=1 Tax=Bacillus sp. PS06 TaxID=2764176 RepID=UPI001786F34B|nr:DHA2 family efflux MFS transporter permease subunit [Bacillus sp. PS06]MBD8070829.1 multidrug efflux MFS transporter [Bacillus sp. PS06]
MNASGSAVGQIDVKNIKRAPIMISLIIGAFFAILNETLLNVAFTDLISEFQVEASTIQWLATGFMLVVGILVPVTALLTGWFTTRQMFIGAMVVFTIGTIICGIAPNFSTLLIGRLIQAGGTGLLMPVMMNTILLIYPPHKRGGAMGTIGLVIMFAPAIGPTLSGVILEALNWRWLFFIVLPFAIFSIVFASIYLKNVSEVTKPKVDYISVILSTLGFGGIVFGFSSAGEGSAGWTHPEVYIAVIVGIVSLILFVIRQLKLEEPMLDVRVFKYPMFAITAVLLIITMMALFSTIILLPMLLRSGLAFTAFMTGLALLPGGLINGLISPITGRLFDKFGPRKLVIPGTIILVIIMWFFSNVSKDTSIFTFIVLHTSLSIGIAMIMMPTQTNALNELTRKHYSHGTAILNTLQQVAAAIGVALFISIMSSGQSRYLSGVSDPSSADEVANSMIAGVQTAFTVGLVFAVIGLILALFIKRTVAPDYEESEPVQKPLH